MEKIITFGEILMRLSPENNLRFSQGQKFDVIYGGGEFNVSASLANYGISTEFVTAIPNNAIGECAINTINQFNVGHKHIVRKGERLGIYFLENGTGIRNSQVVYDRAHSAISEIKKEDIDWKEVFKDATWFHWSGITPAISATAAEVCLEAVKTAFELGLTISTDLNFRSKLWKYGKEPKEVMPQLLKFSHVVLGDIDTAFFMLGEEKINAKYTDEKQVKENFSKLQSKLPNTHTLGMTFRNSLNASHQIISGLLYTNEKLYKAKKYDVTYVVDRVGTGDAFMGGLIYGLITYKNNPQKTIDFATAACAIKHTIFGDVNRATVQEVLALAEGDGTAKVSR